MTSPLVLPPWLPSFDDMRRRDEQLIKKFYLVRIAGNAGYDQMRDARGHKHPYLTLACLPQPFSGVDEGIYGVFHALGVPGSEIPKLTAAQRHRFEVVSKLFGPPGAPDLARAHPRTARALGTAETDADVGAFKLGVLEEVSRMAAQRMVDAINDTGLKPPLVVPGLFTHGRLGVLAPARPGRQGVQS